ncbi:MAG: hypothetical protein ACPGTG_07270 [Flavobacteriales bacterium]
MNLNQLIVTISTFAVCLTAPVVAQDRLTPTETHVKKELLAGPFVSYVDHYSTRMWMLVPKGTKEVKLHFESFEEERAFDVIQTVGLLGEYQKGKWHRITSSYLLGEEVPVMIDVQNLQKDKEYNVEVYLDGDLVFEDFTLYMARAHEDDVFFLFGGEMGANQNFDMFENMQRTPNDFMLWGGGNFEDNSSHNFHAINDSYKKTRQNPSLNQFMQSTPQLATWGDRDYSENDFGKTYAKKDSALMAFNLFWPNLPRKIYNYTFAEYGTYGKYDYEDVDLFVLDDQLFRDNEKHHTKFGKIQKKRFFQELWGSAATFKIVVANSGFFGDNADNLASYPDDYNEFIDRFHKGNFSGLVFLSMSDDGQTHFIKHDRSDNYPLYELSLAGLGQGTYARVRVEGETIARRLIIEVYNQDGNVVESQSILASELAN